MSFITSLPVLGQLAAKVVDRLTPDKGESRRAQAELNKAEVEGAPPSRLRLWRSFLGWVLALCFAWEAVARPVLVTYWPGAVLPPPMLEAVQTLLLGMLGLGL